MKKLFLFLAMIVLTLAVSAQSGEILKKNFNLVKGEPTFRLWGDRGVIDFNKGDITLTNNATNVLTLAGGNLIVPNLLTGYSTTATAAGTTTLVVGSNKLQYFTGSTTQIVKLPVASTLALGQEFIIVNNSTGLVTVNSSGSNAVIILGASTSARVTCILISGTTAASWSASYIGIGITSGKKLSASNTLTLAGTDATTMTFPSTSATIARTDAANTFTGNQTIGGVTMTGATGTGNLVFSASPTFTGTTTVAGFALATASTHIWAAGGSTVLATAGTDAACSNGDRYWTEVMIPYNTTITGLSYLVGSVGGTDSVVVQLVNSIGTQVATSRAVNGAAAIVGTAAQFQSVPFTATYDATAGLYYAVVQFNGTTAKFRTYPIPGSKFIAGTVAGTWLTAAGITPGTTFTAGKGPICITY